MNDSTLLHLGPNAWVLVLVLAFLAACAWKFLLHRPVAEAILASARCVIQLLIVAVLIAFSSAHPWLYWPFVLVMFVVAGITSGRRVAKNGRWWFGLIPVLVAVLPVSALFFLSGVLPWNGLAVIAVIGQQIGGAMTATTLSGRRFEAEILQRRGEVEAAVALGFSWFHAKRLVTVPIAVEGAIPSLDQARTAGLVTLPGAFVGLVLGGASPWAAAQVQVLVLISLTLVASLASWTTLQLSCRGFWHRNNSSSQFEA